MAKTTSLNIRISPEFRSRIERLAEFHGLTMSSYAHSLLVKAVRVESEALGISEESETRPQIASSKVAARIMPATSQKERIRDQYGLNADDAPRKKAG